MWSVSHTHTHKSSLGTPVTCHATLEMCLLPTISFHCLARIHFLPCLHKGDKSKFCDVVEFGFAWPHIGPSSTKEPEAQCRQMLMSMEIKSYFFLPSNFNFWGVSVVSDSRDWTQALLHVRRGLTTELHWTSFYCFIVDRILKESQGRTISLGLHFLWAQLIDNFSIHAVYEGRLFFPSSWIRVAKKKYRKGPR